jgi:crotonobetainyl-CoA:carnitine CoA-transferase CaiB-like acyl-CoA transferase
MGSLAERMFGEAWSCLGGAPAVVRWSGPEGLLPSRLQVAALAEASVAAAATAGAELAAVRGGGPVPEVTVTSNAVATAFASDRVLRLDGRPQESWAPLSRFWKCSDGWVRTHANYGHHRLRLLAALGIPADAADATGRVEHAIGGRTGDDVAEAVTARGGIAVAVRSAEDWARHGQGRAVAALPLLTLRRVGPAPPVTLKPCPAGPLLPAAGLRVLDLTRVIAGPVATRTLALLGADVLRIDSPELPELPAQHLDTGMGKRSACLNLARPTDRETFEGLLASADVVVTGYRPGSLERFGLGTLHERHPGLVVASVSAWSTGGPWRHRRGFDSIVQAACGIAEIEGAPGALPVQALDHASGYLLAAAVLRAVSERTRRGGGWRAEVSLAQTAAWLLRQPIAARATARRTALTDDGQDTAVRATALGTLRYALSPVAIDGASRDWAHPVRRHGSDPAAWQPSGGSARNGTVREGGA